MAILEILVSTSQKMAVPKKLIIIFLEFWKGK